MGIFSPIDSLLVLPIVFCKGLLCTLPFLFYFVSAHFTSYFSGLFLIISNPLLRRETTSSVVVQMVKAGDLSYSVLSTPDVCTAVCIQYYYVNTLWLVDQ